MTNNTSRPDAIAVTEQGNSMTGELRRSDDREPRSKAELLRDLAALEASSDTSTAHLLHELIAHQIELEMQNHELCETQRQLEEVRDRYANLYDFSPVGYLTLDEAGNILEINLTGTAILGQTRAALVGNSLAPQFILGDIQPFFHHLREVFRSSNNVVTELKIKQPNGAQRPVRLESLAVEDAGGKPPACLMVMTDITEHKLVEEERLRFASILERSLNEVYVFEQESLRFKYVNDCALNNLGYSLDEIRLKTPLDLTPKLSKESFCALIEPLLRHEQEKVIFETEHLRSDGTLYAAEVHLQLIESGGNCMFLAVVNDITERKQSERRSRELLEENRSLTRRMFTLQERERSYIARELHDELGQWLTAIEADAEAIHRIAAERSNIRAGAQAIRDSAAHVHEVIRRLVQRLRPSLLDELGLADSLRELVSQWQKRHVDIACKLTLGDFCGNGNDDFNITAYRVVQEALTNIALHAEAKHVSIAFYCTTKDGSCDTPVLKIDDDGKGMEPALVTRGVGLLGMRERVIAAGGEFFLRSAPGCGVHIEIHLPSNVLKEKSDELSQDTE